MMTIIKLVSIENKVITTYKWLFIQLLYTKVAIYTTLRKVVFIQFSVVYKNGYLYTLVIECTKCRKSGQRSITAAEGQQHQ